ncbi:chromo (CHRromatin Organization MOdifier) domain protein [Puccinia sorghi]|uniref:Chromo (CHRromatin Organization MOdifier) domain protein n=1 Tax=Puccinia sorghi TaxID=27349 RepID=A0A0L6V1E3_9BASI|nr:chromo (CHRromatin Organization MOdifier) domain protein [Puccinia sorghi]
MLLIPLLDNLLLKPFMGEILSLTLSISFKSNFESTSKQPVNITNSRPINFAFNLPSSTLTNSEAICKKARSIQNRISCFEELFQTLSSFEMEGNPPSVSFFSPRASQGTLPGQNSSSSGNRQCSEWEVSRILDARLHKGKLQYLVKWAGHQSDKD